jgi:hypothetical protein
MQLIWRFIMIKRLIHPRCALAICALSSRRAFAAAAATPASTRHARNLNATSISVTPDFSLTSSAKLIEAEQTYSAHNYHPLPVVFSRAQGVHVWDPEGRRYFDFLSACVTPFPHCIFVTTCAGTRRSTRATRTPPSSPLPSSRCRSTAAPSPCSLRVFVCGLSYGRTSA